LLAARTLGTQHATGALGPGSDLQEVYLAANMGQVSQRQVIKDASA
jgi:hypothetical protein